MLAMLVRWNDLEGSMGALEPWAEVEVKSEVDGIGEPPGKEEVVVTSIMVMLPAPTCLAGFVVLWDMDSKQEHAEDRRGGEYWQYDKNPGISAVATTAKVYVAQKLPAAAAERLKWRKQLSLLQLLGVGILVKEVVGDIATTWDGDVEGNNVETWDARVEVEESEQTRGDKIAEVAGGTCLMLILGDKAGRGSGNPWKLAKSCTYDTNASSFNAQLQYSLAQ